MKIAGLQKLTLLDYPGKTACTVFFGGCNFRCPFCHNWELLDGSYPAQMEEAELLAFLEKRRGMMEGVCITGGEPLLSGEITPLLEKIRAAGFEPGMLHASNSEAMFGCKLPNLDAVRSGVNCCLAQRLGLTEVGQLHADGVDDFGEPYGIGRVGLHHEEGLSCAWYAEHVKRSLGAASVRFVDTGRPVGRVAVGGGSCGSMLADAVAAGCDTFVTSDVKYDQYLEAKALGICLMDAGHYATENVVCEPLAARLKEWFPALEVTVSECHREAYTHV